MSQAVQRAAAPTAASLAFTKAVAARPAALAAGSAPKPRQALKHRAQTVVKAGERPDRRLGPHCAIDGPIKAAGTGWAAGVPPGCRRTRRCLAPGAPPTLVVSPCPAAVAAPVANGSAPSSVSSASKPMDIVSAADRWLRAARG